MNRSNDYEIVASSSGFSGPSYKLRIKQLEAANAHLHAENISLQVRYERALALLENIRQQIEQWLPRER